MRKRIVRFGLALIALGMAAAYFLGWQLLPKKPLDIVVVNKTTGLTRAGAPDYRRHEGLIWLLGAERYGKPGTGELYALSDYYGYKPNGQAGGFEVEMLGRLEKVPDIVYLSDAYGVYEEMDDELIDGGLSAAEVALISNCHTKGSVIIGEYNIASAPTDPEVAQELGHLFGVNYTRWFGKWFPALESTEVPGWVRSGYEREYGERWNLRGGGIVIASDAGDMLILKQGEDFDGQGVVIQMLGEYAAQYPAEAVGFYDWFEFVRPKAGTEVLAGFMLNIRDKAVQKVESFGLSTRFPAVVRNQNAQSLTYYFAGDFSDYVGIKRTYKTLFAAKLFETFSLDKPGDTSNFYWRFYVPLLSSILAETGHRDIDMNRASRQAQIAELGQGFFSVDGGAPTRVRGMNLNGVMPGMPEGEYPMSSHVYRTWFEEMRQMGINCVRVYALMPPAFYSALEEHNLSTPGEPMYLIQNIAPAGEWETIRDEGFEQGYRAAINQAVAAIHGQADVVRATGDMEQYVANVSQYLLAYAHAPLLSDAFVSESDAMNAEPFGGAHFASEAGATATEIFVASVLDYTTQLERERYGISHLQSVIVPPTLVPRTPWEMLYSNGAVFDIARIRDNAGNRLFMSLPLNPAEDLYLDNLASLAHSTDEDGEFAYGGYLDVFIDAQTRYPILVDSVGLPTNINVFEAAGVVNGLSEDQQGDGIVRMVRAIETRGLLGFCIYEWTDSWGKVSEGLRPYALPAERTQYWHNAIDAEQNFGIIAVESLGTNSRPFTLSDRGVMSSTTLSADETYLYITVHLNEEINFEKNALAIGLDTYERNLGEYLYAPMTYATALSGMEFVIRFASATEAELMVTPSYSIAAGRYASDAVYVGTFDTVCKLTYGSFSFSNTQFYKTGPTFYIRLPWASINCTDPSRHMVMHTLPGNVKEGEPLQTVATDGIMLSLVVTDRLTKDTIYHFPVSKSTAGYRTYKWLGWEKPSYTMRPKSSYEIIANHLRAGGGQNGRSE